ncbi:hypothetical protein [Polycladidibacter hongkongensis]|uniref:hypothetical protein n=1 Tax=Polycladidibacter hongkongensis TaxID=1647556 RepID=UPI0008356B24|nr:hypothetical protein [Pseudovibrio hongkongensis]
MQPETRKHLEQAAADNTRRWGELVELKFLSEGRADGTRQNQTVLAVIKEAGSKRTSATGGRSDKWQGRIQKTPMQAYIAKSLYLEGPLIFKGDKLRAVEREGKPFFEVAAANYDNPIRIILELASA